MWHHKVWHWADEVALLCTAMTLICHWRRPSVLSGLAARLSFVSKEPSKSKPRGRPGTSLSCRLYLYYHYHGWWTQENLHSRSECHELIKISEPSPTLVVLLYQNEGMKYDDISHANGHTNSNCHQFSSPLLTRAHTHTRSSSMRPSEDKQCRPTTPHWN